MLKKLIFLSLFVILQTMYANSQQVLEVVVARGDGSLSLMRRYRLDRFLCNFQEFYRLNNIKANTPLLLGRKYKLPILIYPYNGKSIRTTIRNSDLARARMIEQYNKDMVFTKVRQKYFLEDKSLWVPYHVFNCADPATVPFQTEPFGSTGSSQPTPPLILSNPTETPVYSGKTENVPIFGLQYSKVPIIDETLKDKVFYLKGGHGGPDPGAMAKIDDHICCEDEYAYDVSLRLGKLLISHGAIVHFIVIDPDDGIRNDPYLLCDKDERQGNKESIPLNQIFRLRARVNYVNTLYNKYKKAGIKDQRFISIHVDSRTKNLPLDVHFYYMEGSKLGLQMAENTQKVFLERTKQSGNEDYSGTIKGRDLYVLKFSYPIALFVEIGNIQNIHDQERIIQSTNRQLIANWLYEGITK